MESLLRLSVRKIELMPRFFDTPLRRIRSPDGLSTFTISAP